MTNIKDLADLKRFLSLCRRQGVKDIRWADLQVTFGDAPPRTATRAEDESDIQTEEPSIEELMFLSAGGPPT